MMAASSAEVKEIFELKRVNKGVIAFKWIVGQMDCFTSKEKSRMILNAQKQLGHSLRGKLAEGISEAFKPMALHHKDRVDKAEPQREISIHLHTSTRDRG